MTKSILDGLTINDDVTKHSNSANVPKVVIPGHLEEVIDLSCPPKINGSSDSSLFGRIIKRIPQRLGRYALLGSLSFLFGGATMSECLYYDFSFSKYGDACKKEGYIMATVVPQIDYGFDLFFRVFTKNPKVTSSNEKPVRDEEDLPEYNVNSIVGNAHEECEDCDEVNKR